MAAKNGTRKDQRRISRREARLEEKMVRAGNKPPPLFPPLFKRILLGALAVILVILGAFYFYQDSISFVATVDGRRITNEEYSYFLKLQQRKVETSEGLDERTEDERRAFWSQDAVDGENPVVRVKNDALSTAKEYAIQVKKANELGLTVNDAIRSRVQTQIDQLKTTLGIQYESSLEEMGLTEAGYREILGNYFLIDTFRARHIEDNFTPAQISSGDIEAEHEANSNLYDTISSRIIHFMVTQEDGEPLEDAGLEDKRALANEVLAKIKDGADMEVLARERSEVDTAAEDGGLQELHWGMQRYMPEIIDWAFAGEAGDLELIETVYGIFVIRIESRTGLTEATNTIRTVLLNRQEEAFYTEELDSWMKEPTYNVVINERVFETFTIN